MLPQPHTRNARRLSHAHGLASSPFAHHYSGNHCCFLFLRVLRCFTSPRYHQPPYQFRRRQHPMTSARFPHSEIPGSKLGCQLPGAYRRLPRPSSAPGTKASTVCPKKLEHTNYAVQKKMLASTMQFSKHGQNQPTTTTRPPRTRMRYSGQTGLQKTPTPHTVRKEVPEKPRHSVRSLRTQQCARPQQTPTSDLPTPRTPKGPETVPTTGGNPPEPNSQRSTTYEQTHPRHVRP